MGIYERDYVRNRPPQGYGGGGGIPSARTWSINTWIIVLCIGVFVLDGFTSRQWVSMGVQWDVEVPRGERELGRYKIDDIQGQPSKVLITQQAIRDTQTGQIVGMKVSQSMPLLTSWLHFSTERGFLGFQFWRFIGFQFLHANLTHLLFNMMGLYFFGSMVERYLGSKRYLAFYLLSGIFGALVYLILNLGGHVAAQSSNGSINIPGLLFNDTFTPLVGASAGVFGVLMAGAFLAPNATVLLFFFIPMPLKFLAYGLVVVAFIAVLTGSTNAGGEAGHLGGALAGWYFIRHPRHLHNFFDVLGRIDPTSHHYRGSGKARGGAMSRLRGPKASQTSRSEIDRILDKVHAQGLAALSEKEKRILREASEDGP
ncbi:MAG: rhomboid family intramembrane serine protease [Planctomycetota bacterium]|nr:rhomboid family intramembrane serine protease [Planctomycetota bacterium]